MAFYSGSYLLDLVGLLTAIVAVGYAYALWKFQYWKNRNIPYLEPIVPWGNLDPPFNRTKSIGEEMVELYKKAKSKGKTSVIFGWSNSKDYRNIVDIQDGYKFKRVALVFPEFRSSS